MSVRSSRRLQRSNTFSYETSSPLGSSGNILIKPLSSKGPKGTKKIRRTRELVYFNLDSPGTEEKENVKITRSSARTKGRKQLKIQELPQLNLDSSVEEKVDDIILHEAPSQAISQPVESNSKKRKIVRAKRLLTKSSNLGSVEESAIIISDSETKKELKKKRQRLRKQSNIEQDSVRKITVKEQEEIIEKDKQQNTDASNGQNDTYITETTELTHSNGAEEQKDLDEKPLVHESKQKKLSTDLVITTLEKPISPSTSCTELDHHNESPLAQASIENIFHFNSSQENLQPSTSGTSKRRTYELETSINDVSLLKSVSEQDSLRINSVTNNDKESLLRDDSDVTAYQSKVTLRRKHYKNNSFDMRLSKISPPWTSGETCNNAATTSTPMSLKKSRSLLKDVLVKVKPSTGKKHASSVKIPNFAAIHKKALEKMESLSEYKQRKEQRAKMLLSGKKPSTNTPKRETKKQLRFAPNTSDKEKSPGFIPLPSTPLPKKVANDSIDSPAITPEKTKTPKKFATPKFNFTDYKQNLFPIHKQLLSPRTDKNDGSKFEKVKVLTPKNKRCEVFNFGNNGYNRFGFHTAKPVTVMKKEEIKTMITTKGQTVKNTIESRRVIIKGVRSNRRFDLLMNMRKGK